MNEPSRDRHDVPTDAAPRPRWQRALGLALAFTLTAEPALASASLLAQQPLFVKSVVPPNVMLVMDDSASMGSLSLPRNTAAIPQVAQSGPGAAFVVQRPPQVYGDYWAVNIGTMVPGFTAVSNHSRDDWVYRSAALNPLFYNPAVTYKPWNLNGTLMPNAGIGGTGTVANADLTRTDYRFTPASANTTSPVSLNPNQRGTISSNGRNFTGGGHSVDYPGMPGEPAHWALGLSANGDPKVTITSGGLPDGTQPTSTYGPGLDLFTNPPPFTVRVDRCTSHPSTGPNAVCEWWTYCKEPNSEFVAGPAPNTRYIVPPASGFYTGDGSQANPRARLCAGSCRLPSGPPWDSRWVPHAPPDQPVTYHCPDPWKAFNTSLPTSPSCSQWRCGSRATTDTVLDHRTPARYFVFRADAAAASGLPNPLSGRGDPRFYELVEIDRAVQDRVFVVRDAQTGAAATREDCAAKSTCTWREEAQNYANWYAYYRNRLFAAIAVTSHALASLGVGDGGRDEFRIGFGRLNYFAGATRPLVSPSSQITSLPALDGMTHPGTIERGVRPFLLSNPSNQRLFVFHWLFSLHWVGSTPNREAVDSVGKYFEYSGKLGPWSALPGDPASDEADKHLACRRSFLLMATDGEWTRLEQNQPLIENRYATGGYTPRNADGIDRPGAPHAGSGPALGMSYNWTLTGNRPFTGGSSSQQDTLSDATVYYWATDLRPDLPNSLKPNDTNPAFWQHMSTYIIGYGVTASMDTTAHRTAMSATPGTTINWPPVGLEANRVTDTNINPFGNRINDSFRAAMASRGGFYSANDPEALRTAILGAFADIDRQTSSGTAVAATAGSVTDGDRIYAADFTTGDWTGTLRAYDAKAMLTAMGTANAAMPAPAWSATIPSEASRNILTSRAKNDAATFTWSGGNSINAAQRTQLLDDSTILDYLRGSNALEAPTGPYRRRLSRLGDIVNSSPVFVRSLDWGYRGSTAASGPNYPTFVSTNRTSRTGMVYVGANDGMLHAFNANTGAEVFAYVPRAVYSNLPYLRLPGYPHRYFVDGPVIHGDYYDGGWKTAVLGSTGAGGKGLFALDVTNPASVGAGNVLFDVMPGDPDSGDRYTKHLGSVLGAGVIGSAKNGQWVAIVGNGAESANHTAALLVIDIRNGDIVRAIDTGAGSAAVPNGLGAITPVYDAARNIIAVYAGDRLGNLWKFDLSSTSTSDWKIATPSNKPLFKATEGSTTLAPGQAGQPISTAPRLTQHPLGGVLISFGTGKFYETDDGVNAQQQSIYVFWEKADSGSAQVAKSSLRAMSWGTSGTDRVLQGAPMNWRTDLGWHVPLPTAGERVIANPIVNGSVVSFTSYLPLTLNDKCDGGGTSYNYAFDLAGGTGIGKASSALVGGGSMLRLAPEPRTPTKTTTASQLQTMMPGRFDAEGRAIGTQASNRSACLSVGSNIVGSPTGVNMACPPNLPVRVWRQELR